MKKKNQKYVKLFLANAHLLNCFHWRRIGFFCLAGMMASCISPQAALELDRSLLNQPAADLLSPVHQTQSPLTGLRSASSGAATCSMCAK